MKIVIEGCDGTGKSTLVKKLVEKYNLDSMHITSKDPNDFDFYKQSLRKTNVVYDRSLIGELIYPDIYSRKGKMSFVDVKYLVDKHKDDTVFFVLTTDIEEIQRRLNLRGDEHDFVFSNVEYINFLFLKYANLLNIPVIDTSQVSFEEICEKYIDNKLEDCEL